MIVVETERLRVRRITFDDAQFVIDILNSPGWLDNIGDRKVNTILEAHTYIGAKIFSDYEKVGFGMYLMEEKEDGRYIGMSGFVDRPGIEGIDLGFALLPDEMNKGYAFESCQSLLLHAMQKEIILLKAITLPGNKPSIKLLDKLGFKWKKDFHMEGDPELLCLYECEL